jgi:hypothetical protein
MAFLSLPFGGELQNRLKGRNARFTGALLVIYGIRAGLE